MDLKIVKTVEVWIPFHCILAFESAAEGIVTAEAAVMKHEELMI